MFWSKDVCCACMHAFCSLIGFGSNEDDVHWAETENSAERIERHQFGGAQTVFGIICSILWVALYSVSNIHTGTNTGKRKTKFLERVKSVFVCLSVHTRTTWVRQILYFGNCKTKWNAERDYVSCALYVCVCVYVISDRWCTLYGILNRNCRIEFEKGPTIEIENGILWPATRIK